MYVTESTKYAATAGETMTAGATNGYEGRAVCWSTAADDTVLLPAAGTDVPFGILTAGGASGDAVECEGLVPGRTYMVRLGGTVTRGAYGEIKLTSSDFGKFIAYSSGTKRVQFKRAGVAGDLVPAVAL